MMSSGHKEVTCFLSLVGPYIAISCELIVTSWVFIFRKFVDIELFILLCRFQMVTFKEHLDFETQVILIRVGTNSQIIESVFFVHCVFHIVEVSLMSFEEFVIFGVVGKTDSFLKFVSQNCLADKLGLLALRCYG